MNNASDLEKATLLPARALAAVFSDANEKPTVH